MENSDIRVESDVTLTMDGRRGSNGPRIKKKTTQDSIQDKKLKREQKALYALLNIIVVFLICWIPFYILFVVRKK